MQEEAADQFATRAARVAADHRAEQIVVMDLRGLTSIADFFVVCTGTSDRQIRTVCDRLEEDGRKVGRKPFRVSGYENAQWVLLDFVDVVVHIFDRQKREYYDLELLWGDAPRIDFALPATA